ncbi:MAG: ComEC/Rec2 family competence protein [FCB group bacterium]|nr:ComEC/Rec2 family competence protein [FCB group bacterium]
MRLKLMFAFRYPAVIILALAIVGILLGKQFNLSPNLYLGLTIACGLSLIYCAIRLPRRLFILPLAGLTLIGACFISNLKYRSFPTDDIIHIVDSGTTIRFFGKIEKWPIIKRNKTILTCHLDSIILNDLVRTTSGSVLATVNTETTQFALGDRISFAGRLRTPRPEPYPDRFDYARYLEHKGVRGTVYVGDQAKISIHTERRSIFGRAVADLRLWIKDSFKKNLTETPAALATGFLIGETRDIPEDIYLAFRRTGTMHLLAVSGSNVVLVLIVVAYILRFLPFRPKLRLLILLVVIIVFSHLSYNQPSVVRASIMAAFILLARAVFRRAELNNIVAATAAILILSDPGYLFDVGFQLSFAVAWALILFLPHINQRFRQMHLAEIWRYVLLIISCSFIASVISAPITAYYFGEISLVTIASNLIIVPLVSLAVIGIVILLLVNLALPVAAVIPGVILDRLLQTINFFVNWFDGLSFTSISLPPFPAALVFVALIMTVVFFLSLNNRLFRRILLGAIPITGIIYLAVSLWPSSTMDDLELINNGSTQAIIIDRGGGVVIFRQAGDYNYDVFSQSLLPYLRYRRSSMPKHFLFMEPRYRTERRLDMIIDTDYIPRLRPADRTKGLPSLWYNIGSGGSETIDSVLGIYRDTGLIVIDIDSSIRLVVSERSGVFSSQIPNSSRKKSMAILFAEDSSELLSLMTDPGDEERLIFLENPVEAYNIISGSQIASNWQFYTTSIVNQGERLYISRAFGD